MAAARHGVLVFGSLNMDLVVRVPRMPQPGETIGGHDFITNAGGKGANQAVACARQGGQVRMFGKVGDDGFGASLRAQLESQGVDATQVGRDASRATGIAMIMVDDAAQNCIAVVAGANGSVTESDAEAMAPALASAAMLLLQLEVPMPAVMRAATTARHAGCPVLLNPAPMAPLPDALLSMVDILVVNETEARMLSGLPEVTPANAAEAARHLLKRGAGQVIVTLGEHGAVHACAQGVQVVPAVPVQAVDTTAAGDTFIGALAAELVTGRVMAQALRYAVHAAALCVTRAGAQDAMPLREEVERSLQAAAAAVAPGSVGLASGSVG